MMERLDTSLDNLLETTPSIPLTLKRSLLTDVARGLLYLHTRNPPVMHRDLSARNVLLTSSLVAKISDLGNTRIVNLRPGQLATLTRVPGTLSYMPPESFDESPAGHLLIWSPCSLHSHTGQNFKEKLACNRQYSHV